MSNTPHQLAEEFPQDVDQIHQLKLVNAHFAKLFDEYHDVNRAVHRAETLVEPVEQLREAELRQQRMRLKDEIQAMLQTA